MTRDEAVKWLQGIEERYFHGGDEVYDKRRREAVRMAIEALERKRGEWIPVEDSDCWRGFLCSVCNKAVNQRENYCPNCGSYMRGDTDER